MKVFLLAIVSLSLSLGLYAQHTPVTYYIRADSTMLTGCDSNELIIGNHTQNIPGFLFNTGNGRTIFKRGAQQLGNGSYVIGGDTLKAWVQGGNAFGATGVLGTLDNNHLDLYTNNTPGARLTNTGNFLIGSTTDNGSKLQVNGAASVNGNGGFNGYLTANPLTSSDGAGGYYYLRMGNASLIGGNTIQTIFQGPTTSWQYIFEFGNTPNLGSVAKDLIFSGNGSGNIVVGSANNYISLGSVSDISVDASPLYLVSGGYNNMDGVVVERNTRSTNMTDPLFTVLESTDTVVFRALKNGNVGIGTTTPAAQLHTTGTVRFAGLTSDTTKTRVLVSDANGNLFYRDASTLAANDPIRTSLAINGTITAKRLRLAGKDWPDYVFKKDYQLPTLQSLEKYIAQNHHLPGVAPASEVEKEGVDVGDNQAAMLKNIEELTLYVIGQNKKLETQNKKIEALSREIKRLKKKS